LLTATLFIKFISNIEKTIRKTHFMIIEDKELILPREEIEKKPDEETTDEKVKKEEVNGPEKVDKEEVVDENGLKKVDKEETSNPLFEKIKERYPDTEFTSEDEYLKTLYEDNEELSKDKEKRDKDIAIVQEMFDNDQPYFEVSKMMRQKGIPFLPAVFQTIGIDEMKDIIEAVEKGEDGVNELVKANKENKKMRDTQKSFSDTFYKNRQVSEKVMEEFQKEKNYTDDQMDEYRKWVDNHLKPVWEGKFTKEFFEFFDKAKNYDTKIEESEELVRAQEKNKKVQDEELKKEKKNILPDVKSSEKPFLEKKGSKSKEFFESVNKTINA